MDRIRIGNNARILIPHFHVIKFIKYYGGIDAYAVAFLRTFDKNRLDAQGRQASRLIIEKMLTFNPTEAHRVWLQALVQELTGGKRSKKSNRRQRNRKRSRKY